MKIKGIKTLFAIVVFAAMVFAGKTHAQEVTPQTALKSYLKIEDNAFKWRIHEKKQVGNTTAYTIVLTSQVWREHTWVHQLTVFVPDRIENDGALLFVSGGSVKNGLPNWRYDGATDGLADIADKNKAIVTLLNNTPNQPLYGGLVEDQLISYTLHNWKNDKDYTWPLLFPMVKSAVKAMDAVQEFTATELKTDVNRFVVTGGSKRGWTTWLTASQDKRVEAIAPMVIDVLNMSVSLDYHVEAWQEYSIQIEDYTKLEIPQQVQTSEGAALMTMVDPYSYRHLLAMPKMIFIGTNDEYWPVDAIKHYIDDIPGQNSVHYAPNAGHDIKSAKTYEALNAFFGQMLGSKNYNMFGYELDKRDSEARFVIKVDRTELVKVHLWEANSADRDFRDDEFNSKELNYDGGTIEAKFPYPGSGFKAFYIDLEFKSPTGGTYTKSTRMFVANPEGIL